ncbi:CHAT domain protein [Symmachiella macrocystis]|uniref:CHAT domain protein n=1 Tax=Symmachiella macrocystis TaxID=2527985 RepID=A0A5C6BMG1_9PLAN|nr:CHAT domain-containing protein [Symmachiella macrocystis]TWU12907.1 CHAT domain protein [Symmachiella macrocystis]
MNGAKMTHLPRAAILCCGLLVAILADGQSVTASPSHRDIMQQAHVAYNAGRFLQAEQLFRQVYDETSEQDPQDIATRRICTEQLFEIYYRLGHYDKAIQLGVGLRTALETAGESSRLRSTDIRLGKCYFTLAHYRQAERFYQQALALQVDRPLDPVLKMEGLVTLAMIADRLEEQDITDRRWRTAANFAETILRDHREALPLRDQIVLGHNLARALRKTGQAEQSVAQLQSLLRLSATHDYVRGRQILLAELANQYEAMGDLGRAIGALKSALALNTNDSLATAMSRGDLYSQYSILLNRYGQSDAARQAAEQAEQLYKNIIQHAAGKGHDSLESMNAFWKLKDLLRYTQQYRQAVELVSDQPWNWSKDSLPAYHLTSERGALHAAVGSYPEARRFLTQALKVRRQQDPLDLSQLPRTLNNLALVEQATGNLAEANALCEECLQLYQQYALPEDRDLAETYNLLATNAALAANYSTAVRLYRRGIEICRKCGTKADGHRGNLLLNLAKTYKSQGQYAEAIKQCEEALTIAKSSGMSSANSVSEPAVYCALATMYTAEEDFEKTREFANKTLQLCEQMNVPDGPVMSSAQHCLAIVALVDKDYAQADALWKQVLQQQQKLGQHALTARSYNYLGATAQLQGDLKQAEQSYRAALHVLDGDSDTYPVMRFVSLWKLAQLRHLDGDELESRELLDEAIDIAEETRVDTYGAEQHRADFFSQFAPAFDAVFHLSLRDGDFAQALAYAERGRSRTFLDQLKSAGVDPRQGLYGTADEPLLQKEQNLKRRINHVRSQAQQMAESDATSEETQLLVAELQHAQDEYAKIWHQILDASPQYRNLLVKNLNQWSQLQREVVRPGTMLLYYYLGRSRGYLVVIGDQMKQPEVFMLDIPVGYHVNANVVTARQQRMALSTRGLKRQRVNIPTPAGIQVTKKPLPLTRARADVLVDNYLQSLMVDGVESVRGVRRKRIKKEEDAFGPSSTAMADILLPAAVRDHIRQSKPDRLIVVPDGALHKLPLEALVLSDKPQPRYVLDEFPPISYAPSAGALAALVAQPRNDTRGAATLLTIGDPAYPLSNRSQKLVAAADPIGSDYLGMRGQVDRLPNTDAESRRVASLFDQKRVTVLRGEQATETNVLAALPGQRYLHFAAHAFVDQQHGNLLGGILLTPPHNASDAKQSDGVLALNEIYTLKLNQCELAVLSACETNVGPDGTMEAGFSLARAFFKAGARRVVASHWTVEDESTSELVGEFFEEMANQSKSDQPVNYAKALQTARRRVRNNSRWSHPFFWAPFVLIGPGVEDPSVPQRPLSHDGLGDLSRK